MNLIKKKLNYAANSILTGVSFFTAIRFWFLDLNTIDYITGTCIMIIAIVGAGKMVLGWKIPLIDNFPIIKKIFNSIRTRPERYMKMIETEDVTIIFLFIQFIERIVKTMKNIGKSIIQVLALVFKLNPKTSGANAAVLGLYYAIMRELFIRYHLMDFTWELLTNQNDEFYKWLILYTVGLIVALLGVNSIGWEDFNKWTARINLNKLNKIRNQLIKLDVTLDTEIVERALNKAYLLLKIVKVFIREEEYNKIKLYLDDVDYNLRMFEAKRTLEDEERRQENLRLAQQHKQQLGQKERQEQPTLQDNNYRINR